MTRLTLPFFGITFAFLLSHTEVSGKLFQKSTPYNVEVKSKRHLSQSEQRKFEFFLQEGLRLKYQNRPEASFEMFNRCSSIDSTSATVCYELADLYLKMNNPVLGVEYIRKASQLDPENYWYAYSYAVLAQRMNLNDEAEKAFLTIAEKNPDKPEVNYSLVELYFAKKDYRKAIKMLDKLELQMGLTEEVSLEKSRLYTELKDTKNAFAEIEKLVRAYPKDIRYKIYLGDKYLEINQPKEAFKCYQSAKLIDPDNGYLSVSLANFYEKTGNKVEAESQIQKALLNPKTDVETKNRILAGYLATRLEKKEEQANIGSLFDKLIAMHPQEESFYILYSDYLLSQKKSVEAREKLQFAVGLAPTNVNVWKQLVNVELQLMDYKSLVEVCGKAINYFPEISEFFYYKGMGYFLLEQFDNAIITYNQGVKVTDPKNASVLSDFYGQIGDVYQRLGRVEQAFEAYENALKHNDKNIVVLNNYAYYLSIEKKELGKAEQMSGKCIAADPNNSTYLDTYAWIFFVQKKYTLAKFYIEKALKNGGDKNDVIVEHYGDILMLSGDKAKAIEQWQLSLSLGNKSLTLKAKIENQTYIEEVK